MKTFILLSFSILFSISTFAQGKTQSKKFTMKTGKYRQIFYLPQAQPAAGVYKLDTFISAIQINVAIIGDREGDQFKIQVTTDSAKVMVPIMKQFFFMDGTRTEEHEMNPWITSWKKSELDKFLLQYFGIKVKSRRQFIKEYTFSSKPASHEEACFIGQELDREEKIW